MNRQYGALCGVAIVLIVLNHTITAGDTFAPVEGWAQYLLTVLQAFGTFAVPTFLFISGAFVSYAARGKTALSVKFIWGSVKHILWPYLIWSAVFYLTVLVTRQQSQSLLGYIKSLLVGFPYHFVPLLLFYYIISPLLVIVGKRFGWLLLLGIGLYQLFLMAAVKPMEAFGIHNLPGWTWYLTPPVLRTTMADWAIYFPMGLIFSMHNAALKPQLQRWMWASLTAVALFFLLGIFNAFGIVAAPWARFLAPVPLMFLLPIINRNSIPAVSRFEQVGRRSYGIYLIHFIVLDWVLFAIHRLWPGLFGYPILIYPMLFVVALFVPLLVMEWVAKRPSTRKLYRYVFG
jgi:peptidoglycan/LPS O-acetylase OafA/YrhL